MPRVCNPLPCFASPFITSVQFLLVGWMGTKAPCYFKSRQLAGDFGGLHRGATTEVKFFAAGRSEPFTHSLYTSGTSVASQAG
jgi:hypothetical protein